MKTEVKPETPKSATGEESLISLFSDWVQKGTENFFAAERILLDLVMRQNTMALNGLREKLMAAGSGSGAALAKAAGEGFGNFAEAQKILLDLARRQNEIVMTGVRERVGAGTPAATVADLLRRSVETFIDLQLRFLDVAEKQTKAWQESVKAGKAPAGKEMAELAREGMDSFVQAQKKFLDVVAEEVAKAGKAPKATPKGHEKVPFTDLAGEAAEAFAIAQKKLIETAGKQFEANMKGTEGLLGAFAPLSGSSLMELSRQGFEGFVGAQKALLDVMVKPAAPKAAHHKPPVHPAAHHAGAHAR